MAAVGSYLHARHQGGSWLVRMEDLDGPRNVPGADRRILETLDWFGLEWDGDGIVYQSRRTRHYQQALEQLLDAGLAYACNCSRSDFEGSIYPGFCRDGLSRERPQFAVRVRTGADPIRFDDAIRGPFTQYLETEVGDFVIKRADGLFAYQLAVVVDDADQGVTQVVRGADLLDSTPRQIWLQRQLGLPTPGYAHLPVAVNADGQKLSKQTGAPDVHGRPPVPVLFEVLGFLGQQPPPELRHESLDMFWYWAIANWDLSRVPRA